MTRGPRSSTCARVSSRVRGVRFRRSVHAGMWVAMCGALAAGCARQNRSRDVVVLASGADLESANPLVTVHPLARQVQRYALFVTLARYDSALAPAPYFARKWTWSDDRRTLMLQLEPTLTWHDGVRTTARDVAFTLDAARDTATGYPRAADLSWLERVEVLDDTLVVLHAFRPLAEFPSILCELPIVPEHKLASVARADYRRDAFATAPLGNGPYRFVSRHPGQTWEFERVEHFPASMGGVARIPHFVIAVVDEPATKFAGLVSGDLDVAGIAPTMAPLVRHDATLDVLSYPVFFSYALVFNSARAPFDDVRVRRAVDALIDRQRIIRVALAGYATVATGAVPPEHPFARNATSRLTTGAADSLLDAAGWARRSDGVRARGGAPFRISLLTVGSGDNAAEQLIQADLRAHGIAVDIRQLELGAFLAEARRPTKRFEALVTGIPGDVALSHVVAMFDSQQRGGALDYAAFHEASLDSLFAEARNAPTRAAARLTWDEIQSRLADDVPVAWLYHSRGVQGISRRLRGVQMDLRGELATLSQWNVALGDAPQ